MITDPYGRKVDVGDTIVLYIPADMYEAKILEIRESPVIVPPGEKPVPPAKMIMLSVARAIGPYPGNLVRCPDIVLTQKAGQKKLEELPTGETPAAEPPPSAIIHP